MKYKNIKSEHQLRTLVFDDYFKNKGISWEQEIKTLILLLQTVKQEEKTAPEPKNKIYVKEKEVSLRRKYGLNYHKDILDTIYRRRS